MKTLNEFQQWTATTDIYPSLNLGCIEDLKTLALGLCEEAGEYAGKLKKVVRDDGGILSEEKRVAAGRELGDAFWYLTRSAARLGFTLEEIVDLLQLKLNSRMERGKLGGSGDNR